jgi:hypothetical protein
MRRLVPILIAFAVGYAANQAIGGGRFSVIIIAAALLASGVTFWLSRRGR